MTARTAPPLLLSETSVVDDVLGFIRSAVPDLRSTELGSSPPNDNGGPAVDTKEQVLWVSFEHIGVKRTESYIDDDAEDEQLLVIGYADGFQVWNISEKHNVYEILSLREIKVSSVKVLPPPRSYIWDKFATARPLLFICDNELTSKQPVKLMSLKTGGFLHYDFEPLAPPPVLHVQASEIAVAVVSFSHITLLNAGTLEPFHQIKDCSSYVDPNRGWGLTPTALGQRWLAYCSTEALDLRKDVGMSSTKSAKEASRDDDNVAAFVGLAQNTGTNLWYLGGAGMRKVSDLMNGVEIDSAKRSNSGETLTNNNAIRGVVKILVMPDMKNTSDLKSFVGAHFRAGTASRPLAILSFNPSGTLLASSCINGQDINIFHLAKKIKDGPDIVPQRIYTLRRGLTTVLLRQINFSADSRWVSVVSDHGTTHIFAIMPFGGPVTAYTHTSPSLPSFDPFLTSADVIKYESGNVLALEIKEAHAKIRHPRRPQSGFQSSSSKEAETFSTDKTTAPIMNVTRRLHGAVSTYFGRVPAASGSTPHIRLYVATLDGNLIEHKLYPHGNDDESKAAVKRVVSEEGGVMIGDNVSKVGGALKVTFKTVGDVIGGVRRAVKGSQSSTSSRVSPGDREVDSLHVMCVATHWWEICRLQGWKSTARNLQHKRNGNNDEDEIARDSSSPTRAKDFQRWLAHMELSTYQPPHRRLWMGPQFNFRDYQTIEGDAVLLGGCIDAPIKFDVDSANNSSIIANTAKTLSRDSPQTTKKQMHDQSKVSQGILDAIRQ